MNYTKYWIFGIVLLEDIDKKKRVLVIMEKKLKLYLKKLIKRYQTFQPRMIKILMQFTLVEYLHLVIYQNLSIHPSLLHILTKKKIIKVLFLKSLFIIKIYLLTIDVLIYCKDSQLI